MPQPKRALAGLLFLAMTTPWLCADIRLPKIFSDKMVLQHGDSVTIWGTADANEQLTVTIGESSAKTVADESGRWKISIAPPAVGGPYELAVAGAESRVVFNDVAVGEVWICSGQSNMQWSMQQSLHFDNKEARDAYFAEINNPNIRLFTVPANAVEDQASDFTEAVAWEECRGESASEFSATAYFFAIALQKYDRLKDVPIGLIDSSWGGTPVEAWTSMDAMSAHESLSPLLKHWEENPDNRSPSRPSTLFNGMIAPLIPYSVRGAIWYQGESNVGRARQYQTIFESMIQDWRSRFGQGDIPFYYVQLAPFRYDKDPQALAELWDAQRKSLRIPNTGMIGCSDIGDLKDIHPKNKEVVGQRLARLAMVDTYGQADLVATGPIYSGMGFSEDKTKIIVEFANAEGLKSGGESLEGFLICGPGGEFQPAEARIDGQTVVVWAGELKQPAHVRYLWKGTDAASLFNGADLPAFPFRTDDFELLSKDKDF